MTVAELRRLGAKIESDAVPGSRVGVYTYDSFVLIPTSSFASKRNKTGEERLDQTYIRV